MTTLQVTRSFALGGSVHQELAAPPLVVATNGDAAAAPVIAAARLVAGRLDAAPQVVAVSEPVVMYLPELAMTPLIPEMEAEQRARLVDGVTRVVRSDPDGARSWPIDVVIGSPGRTIARVARERRARMIVMGIGRHAPMDRVFGSETALMTIREADRPVLAVAPGSVGLPRYAVVGMDFSAASVLAAREALALLGEGGTLSLVHVRPPDDILRRVGDGTVRESYARGVADLFDRVVGALQVPATITVERVVLDGRPADQLLGYAEREHADLVATGSSGMGFLERLIVGSVATRIIRHSRVSVLVVPRPSAAELERIERKLTDATETSLSSRWPALLEGFSERNAGRPTQLEIDDPALGAQFQESGYALLGVSYDRRAGQLEIMLGAPVGGVAHMTHTLRGVTSVAVLTDPHQKDLALQARHGDGQTILTFLDLG
ncbi:MAG: universal stress protein [Gemmatimonadaceae bacterium]